MSIWNLEIYFLEKVLITEETMGVLAQKKNSNRQPNPLIALF